MAVDRTTVPRQVAGLNLYAVDRNLQRALHRLAPHWAGAAAAELHGFGAFAGTRLERQAAASDRYFPPALEPVLDDPVAPSRRHGRVRLNADYRDCQQEFMRRGFLQVPGVTEGAQLAPFAAQYLASQADIATGCPWAMTHPIALLLAERAPAELRDTYLPQLLRRDGQAPVGGTWATERHSGSDVGASTTVAHPMDTWRVALSGHQWFASAIGFDRFLAIKTARPPDGAPGAKGLGLYLVPSHLDADWNAPELSHPNRYAVTHLKRKAGTRGLPTGEVELDGTLAFELTPPGDGLQAMMTALGCSRVHNAVGAAGVLHRAYLEALCWTVHRETFGRPLIDRQMVQTRLLDLAAEWLAGAALAFEAARSFDAHLRGSADATWTRLVTAFAKYRTAEQATWATRKALELVGGTGYTDDHPMARIWRDAQVLTVWEGPEQIQALELMRLLLKDDGAARVGDALQRIAADLPAQAMARERSRLGQLQQQAADTLARLQAAPERAEAVADQVLAELAAVTSYALLCREAAAELDADGDDTKRLVAARFERRTFPAPGGPGLTPDALQQRFQDGLAQGRIAAPGVGALA